MRKLARLFFEMFRIALFVIGGGFAIIAVCDDVFSRKLKWTKEGELLDMLPLYQMIPGILAAHNAVYVGRKVAGWKGSLVAIVGVTLPSVVVFTAVSMGYDFIPLGNPWLKSAFVGLRAVLAGVIGAMVVRTWTKNICDAFGYVMFAVAFVALMTPGVPAVAVIGLAVAGGVVAGLAEKGRPPRTVFASTWFVPLVFLQYGIVAFGGGYVLVPIYMQDFVGPAAHHLQIAPSEFANLMALTQMTPGPIGINAATYFGYRLFGLFGGIVSTMCIVLPGFILLSLALLSLEKFKESVVVKGVMRWVRPVTTALMSAAFLSFAGMSCWDPAHTSWCTVGGFRLNLVATFLAVVAFVLTLMRKFAITTLIVASAAISSLLLA